MDSEVLISCLQNNYKIFSYQENEVFLRNYLKDIKSLRDLETLISKREDRFLKSDNKKLIIIAGSIGSGKTNFLHNLLLLLKIKNIILMSPDYYYKIFYPNDDSLVAYNKTNADFKGRLYREAIESGKSQILEVVPAKTDKLKLIAQYKEAGYDIVTFFLKTNDVQINLDRTRKRQKFGMLTIPDEKIKIRHTECSNNEIIERVSELSNRFILIDSSSCCISFNQFLDKKKDETYEIIPE